VPPGQVLRLQEVGFFGEGDAFGHWSILLIKINCEETSYQKT
jgi:hypothetical protein